jgi:putative solute:sodium symporter small subunit
MSDKNAHSYWKGNLKIVLSLLGVWFFISFVCGILLVDLLDSIRIGGFKLGFWIAQQGAIFVFVILVFIYIRLMDKLDAKYEDWSSSASTQGEGEAE